MGPRSLWDLWVLWGYAHVLDVHDPCGRVLKGVHVLLPVVVAHEAVEGLFATALGQEVHVLRDTEAGDDDGDYVRAGEGKRYRLVDFGAHFQDSEQVFHESLL